jgi:GNAT superfamily N-acetyltransferase
MTDQGAKVRLLAAGDVAPAALLLMGQLREHEIPCRDENVAAALREILEDGAVGFVLVAEVGGGLVGVAYVSFARPLEHAGRVAWLEELYVSPEHRQRGVGTSLLREAAARADANGCVSMELEVKRGHERAARLYEREGFTDLERKHFARPLRSWDWGPIAGKASAR